VIAACKHIDTAVKKIACRGRGQAIAVGAVFAVSNYQIDPFIFFKSGQFFPKKSASNTADDISDCEKIHFRVPRFYFQLFPIMAEKIPKGKSSTALKHKKRPSEKSDRRKISKEKHAV
jgi:hypothetical protein